MDLSLTLCFLEFEGTALAFQLLAKRP
jgi:hypothetical protein